jgi:NAD(P)-dependent dehydrogenase (short-subunit alcohol dehydrogenase family)
MSVFSGKEILFVGGSSGIGLELVRRLIAGRAGVTIWSRTEPTEMGSTGYTHSVVDVGQPIDEQDPQSPETLLGLVYCPGSITLGSFFRIPEEQLLADFQINLLGAVRVLQHCPLTDTPMASALLSTPDKRSKADQRHPLGRVGSPSDPAAAAEFLLSPDSSWVTGQVLPVDGGFSSVRLL